MSIINAPCKDCPDRAMGCHDRCKKYLNYKKQLDEIREENYRKRASLYKRGRRKRNG